MRVAGALRVLLADMPIMMMHRLFFGSGVREVGDAVGSVCVELSVPLVVV